MHTRADSPFLARTLVSVVSAPFSPRFSSRLLLLHALVKMDAMIHPRAITEAWRVQRSLSMCHERAHAIEMLDRWIVRDGNVGCENGSRSVKIKLVAYY